MATAPSRVPTTAAQSTRPLAWGRWVSGSAARSMDSSVAHSAQAVRTWSWLVAAAGAWALALVAAVAVAPATAVAAAEAVDPPGRVGRLADISGQVVWFDPEQGRWGQAELNRPLTSGDRLSTGSDGRAELRVGSSVLRLAASTELEVLRLDDQRMVFQLHSGSLALRARSREMAQELELRTGEARFLPQRAGHYRLDRNDVQTRAGVWRGSLLADERRDLLIETGQQLEVWRDSRQHGLGQVQIRIGALKDDAFGLWAQREDGQDERNTFSRYVSPEMTGAEELDRHGQWQQHPEHGALWVPFSVSATWAPYRYGRWTWVGPWGWTWVDDARWGFAPFHYGRWVHWRGRWGWTPGDYVARPVFAPALVAWVGSSSGVSVSIQLPSVAWVPLAPREVFWPYYRHTPIYVDRINHRPVYGPPYNRGQVDPGYPRYAPGRDGRPGRGDGRDGPGWEARDQRDRNHPSEPVRTGPIMYGNQGVPGAVTVVTRDALLRRDSVAAAIEPSRVEALPQARPQPQWRAQTRNEETDQGPVTDPAAQRRHGGWQVQTPRPSATSAPAAPPVVNPQQSQAPEPAVAAVAANPMVSPRPPNAPGVAVPGQLGGVPAEAAVPVRRARPAIDNAGQERTGAGNGGRESSSPSRVREAAVEREEPRRSTPESRQNLRERQQSR